MGGYDYFTNYLVWMRVNLNGWSHILRSTKDKDSNTKQILNFLGEAHQMARHLWKTLDFKKIGKSGAEQYL